MADEVSTISYLEHYKRVCVALDNYVKRMEDSFRLFVQLSLATIGGFIWLKMQPNSGQAADLLPLGRWILPILAAFTVMQILSDLPGWLGYREVEADLLKRPDLKPKLLWSGRLEILRIIGVIAVAYAGYRVLR